MIPEPLIALAIEQEQLWYLVWDRAGICQASYSQALEDFAIYQSYLNNPTRIETDLRLLINKYNLKKIVLLIVFDQQQPPLHVRAQYQFLAHTLPVQYLFMLTSSDARTLQDSPSAPYPYTQGLYAAAVALWKGSP